MMLAGLGRAVRSGWPPGKRQPPVLRGRRDGCPPPSAPQVRLWRPARAWRGREGAPYSTLVPSDDGSKVSDATLMEVLLMNDFKLVINNTAYSVSPPVKDKLSSEHTTEMEDIKSLVHRLFVALHLEDHQIRKERELLQKLDHLKEELLPLEQMKARIAENADAKTSRLLWVGLALMSTQGGALAWLTWWVYSWDIMEPVTYFITYGSAMAFYAYFVLTKQDYIYPDAKDRQFLHYFYRKSKKQHFNVERYNKLKEDLAEAEESLRRLRQPLHLRLPIQEINDKD
ncbi:calcium uniporter regulatory subunit MCUb, mitochondrial isoform X2 [Mycteria americana]|uniref:calcium uniporter regulatory subunit MCUb, mitochondrial isoform X2 n=1 Tax=Mycteria americana TaxID=33587 RepID=UPI003F58E78B